MLIRLYWLVNGILLSQHPQCWDSMSAPGHPTFYMGVGNLCQISTHFHRGSRQPTESLLQLGTEDLKGDLMQHLSSAAFRLLFCLLPGENRIGTSSLDRQMLIWVSQPLESENITFFYSSTH